MDLSLIQVARLAEVVLTDTTMVEEIHVLEVLLAANVASNRSVLVREASKGHKCVAIVAFWFVPFVINAKPVPLFKHLQFLG